MEKNDKGILYINLVIGILGPNLIVLGILKYFEAVGGTGYLTPFLGFAITMIYLNYLERRAGISKKIIWTKSIISIVTLLAFYYFLF
ncbi:hypothetical protein AWH56_002730 [Anaerobacillus isosaccharinicus]|uniref:Uncharacterized protein n=1 Tax=Anaerobacillus isosaccharinicus TaxID=1532552 RepID=A0A1S2MD67_9BACI|nr:hypothetical protein [Anaerobacillus isosaccharinicus]MBA5585041.1 hypothetical protein [Anaerobacillus isosaccharinicus]QOY36610.1 hypothetical protein AWH56_002730 [Anaerobacillus isosaccharinicus]